jgi:hypothetical protein
MWCTILNGALLIHGAVMCLFASDLIDRMHAQWFPMSRETFTIVLYAWLGLFEIGFSSLTWCPLWRC